MEFKKRAAGIYMTGAVLAMFSSHVFSQDEPPPPGGNEPQALGAEGNFFSNLWDATTFQGQFRIDATWRTTSYQNPYNQSNAPFQDRDVPRQAYVPPDLTLGTTRWGQVPLTVIGGVSIPTLEASDTIRRSDRVGQSDLETNYDVLRFSGEMDMRFTQNLRINARLRALYDPTVYDEFDAHDVRDDQGGISGGGGYRQADTGKPNYYAAKARNGRNINPLEVAGRNYFADFSTLIINYKKDNYDIRIGNQQIAWGQAVFFRTFDVANGLDLRRHLVLNRAIEEFEDVRVPKLAIRATAQATDALLIDSYIGKFQPDILTNPNTPYNVIPSQFYKPLDNYYKGNYDTKIDGGVRLKADYGNWGWQAMAVSRYNPLGVFRWAESGITKGLTPASGDSTGNNIGQGVELAYLAKPRCIGNQTPYNNFCRLYGSVAEALSHTPFTVGPGGVYSAPEYFSGAASVRLDAQDTVNTAINEFPALRDVFASPVADPEETAALLNTFFIGSGGSIRGNVQRDYKREQVYGLGVSTVTSADMNSFWDSIIINLEVQYSPDRQYTEQGLSRHFIKSQETIVTAVAEKWYRYTESFPAAYLVFQAMHRTDSDLVGLNLRGYGGPLDEDDKMGRAGGIESANYLVFAGFQPWPNRKYVAEWAFLLDTQGGLLAQPLIKWNPGNGVSIDLFYNYTDGQLYGNGRSTLTRAIDSDDEIGLRINYQL